VVSYPEIWRVRVKVMIVIECNINQTMVGRGLVGYPCTRRVRNRTVVVVERTMLSLDKSMSPMMNC